MLDSLINLTELAPDDRVIPYWILLNASGKSIYSSRAIAGMQFGNAHGQIST